MMIWNPQKKHAMLVRSKAAEDFVQKHIHRKLQSSAAALDDEAARRCCLRGGGLLLKNGRRESRGLGSNSPKGAKQSCSWLVSEEHVAPTKNARESLQTSSVMAGFDHPQALWLLGQVHFSEQFEELQRLRGLANLGS